MTNDATITAVIQIGNSDNKLTQGRWANYAAAMQIAISYSVYRIHFRGGSDWDAPWQNACWVCEITPDQVQPLRNAIEQCRRNHEQDSVALLLGNVELL